MEQKLAKTQLHPLYTEAVELLKKLIALPSFSQKEDKTAQLLEDFLTQHGVKTQRKNNNVWAKNRFFDIKKPTILLNSHHDTVKPNQNYTHSPYKAFEEEGRLYGLGSNDAGGALVSLLQTFLYFYDRKDLKYNLILAATGEEENSGENGISALINDFPDISFALVGEPTQMQMAIAEKALLVVDGVCRGTASHAAHPNPDNPIYKAIRDIQWVENYQFPRESKWLGKVKMTTTTLHAGKLHNQVPAECHFTIDIRVTDAYSTREIFETLQKNLSSSISARSLRRSSSSFPEDHIFIRAGKDLGLACYGSPTSSDQALIPYPSLKMGPGNSNRSHTADEFIYLREIEEGILQYIHILEKINTDETLG